MPQTEADWLALENQEEPIDVLYGGAKGGGKSFFFCLFFYLYALEVIRFFDLPKSDDVPHIGWMGRKVGQVFVGTTLETWKSIVPSSCYELKSATEKHPRHVLIDGRVAIDYGGLDNRTDLEKFNSAEYGVIGVDQAEETVQDDVATLRGSRRKKLFHKRLNKSICLPYRGLWTANPRQCWLKSGFVDRPAAHRIFIPALPSDNPNLPKGYIKTLQESFAHRPELLRAYLDGSWDALEGAAVIIKGEWLRKAKTLTSPCSTVRHILSCDPARYGDDETVIYYFKNDRIVDQRIYGQRSTDYTVGVLCEMAYQYQIDGKEPAIAIDADGIGGPILDSLEAKGKRVIGIQGASKPKNPDRYINLRAEMWWTVGQRYAQDDICEGVTDPTGEKIHCDDEIDRQLTTVEYTWRNGKIAVEPKDDIKKRLGRSPDRGESKLIGLYCLQIVEPVSEQSVWVGSSGDDSTEMANSYEVKTAF